MVEDRLKQTLERIARACAQVSRAPDSVRLLAVSKSQSADKVRALYHCGQTRFGENYVTEALKKQARLADLAIEWHFIGPVQSNKTARIAEAFDWVQSVDRPKIVDRLAAQRPPDRAPLNVLIQVNIDNEDSKAGCRPDQIAALAKLVSGCDRLRLRGLMAIPAPRSGADQQLDGFIRLRALFDRLRRDYPSVDTLSAGMSADLEAAIAAGSTMVRVGTALMGRRDQRRPSGPVQ